MKFFVLLLTLFLNSYAEIPSIERNRISQLSFSDPLIAELEIHKQDSISSSSQTLIPRTSRSSANSDGVFSKQIETLVSSILSVQWLSAVVGTFAPQYGDHDYFKRTQFGFDVKNREMKVTVKF